MPRKVLEREKARQLRRSGMPYKKLAAAVGASVGFVFLWTSDIELTKEQLERNRRGPGGPQNPENVRRRATAWVARSREARRASQADGRGAARQGDRLHLAGCMLYWAEGAKDRNTLKFSNSDPRMLVLFRRFLTDALAVESDEIVMSINVYTNNGISIEEIEAYWLDLLDLPRSSVRKHTVNHMPTSSSGRARNKHLDRAAHLRGCSGVRRFRRARLARLTRSGPRGPGARGARFR
jgi:hypothetical protein